MNGVKNTGEQPLANVPYRIVVEATGKVLASGRTSTLPVKVTVPVGSGQVVRFSPLAGYTGSTVARVPLATTGNVAAKYGSCGARR
jgi:hypothetical protein